MNDNKSVSVLLGYIWTCHVLCKQIRRKISISLWGYRPSKCHTSYLFKHFHCCYIPTCVSQQPVILFTNHFIKCVYLQFYNSYCNLSTGPGMVCIMPNSNRSGPFRRHGLVLRKLNWWRLYYHLSFFLFSQLLPPMADAVLAFVIGELEKRQILCRMGGLIRFTNENVRWQHNPSFWVWAAPACFPPLDNFPLVCCRCLLYPRYKKWCRSSTAPSPQSKWFSGLSLSFNSSPFSPSKHAASPPQDITTSVFTRDSFKFLYKLWTDTKLAH